MADKTYLKTTLAILVSFIVLCFSGTAQAAIIYVDANVTGAKDGSSWANAYKYLQDALAAAYSGDEIRVAQGIYKPDRGTRITHRDRDATFQLINGVTIKGGYAGYSEPNPNACDVDLYETILSGDLNGDDGPNFANNAENSYQVVNGSGTDATAVLDGVTITAGNANGTGTYGYGSGMYNDMGSPTLTNCTFNRNWADGSGGGMYNYDGRPTLINCTFSDNSAGNKGGGVYSHDTYEMTLINCRFSGNSAGEDGGGMACWYNYNNSPTLTNCIFSGNSAGNKGGGMSFVESEPVLSNCSFSGNSAGNKGGGIYMNFWYGYPALTNCILWGNSDFAGMAESAQINTDSYGPPVINYICVQGWTGVLGGIGNIDADPCFVEPGYWDANGVWVDGDYHLLQDSPCIDAGDPNYIPEPNETDLDGSPRVIGGRIDMGAYEFLRASQIIYVDDDANGANDGSSWSDAYNHLQDALAAAWSSDEIWVAQGIYKPDQGAGIMPGDRETTFQLINGVALKGGYAGFGAPDPDARDINLYETTLSGDNNGDDTEVDDPLDLDYRDDNSRHVVTGSGTDQMAVLDGFTVTGGSGVPFGGGMYNDKGSPTIINCTFSWNGAAGSSDCAGGGMFNNQSSPTLIDCTFSHNAASWPGGGGISNLLSSSPTLINCVFVGNKSGGTDGGTAAAMDNWEDSSPTLFNCLFIGNYTEGLAGAIYSGGNYVDTVSNPTLINCTFVGNSAGYRGGAIIQESGTLRLTNCIMWNNTAPEGNVMYLQQGYQVDATVNISYSDIEGEQSGFYIEQGCTLNWGDGNIDAAPCFVEPGYWDANGVWVNGDYHLLPSSPCIDAGDPNYIPEPNETDLDGRPRIIGDRIDMGAYEYRPSILAEVRIVPRTINLTSKGKWITCHISLPEDYNVADIDPNSVFFEHEIQAELLKLDEEQQVATARFNRSDVQGILNVGQAELTITGQLTDGTIFEATDIIRVLNKAGRKSAK